jgi:hypothetical protein
MSEGMSAQGTLIAVSHDPKWPIINPSGGVAAFTNIGELREITAPALTRNTIELTNHNNADDEYIVGIRRHGDMTFNVNFVPRNSTIDHLTGLQQKWFTGSRNIYKLTYPDGTAWMFSGFITNFGVSAPVDDRLSADVTIRPTGRHDWIVGTPNPPTLLDFESMTSLSPDKDKDRDLGERSRPIAP